MGEAPFPVEQRLAGRRRRRLEGRRHLRHLPLPGRRQPLLHLRVLQELHQKGHLLVGHGADVLLHPLHGLGQVCRRPLGGGREVGTGEVALADRVAAGAAGEIEVRGQILLLHVRRGLAVGGALGPGGRALLGGGDPLPGHRGRLRGGRVHGPGGTPRPLVCRHQVHGGARLLRRWRGLLRRLGGTGSRRRHGEGEREEGQEGEPGRGPEGVSVHGVDRSWRPGRATAAREPLVPGSAKLATGSRAPYDRRHRRALRRGGYGGSG